MANKAINSKEVNEILATAFRNAKTGRVNKDHVQGMTKLAAVIIRNACAEMAYARLQKGKIKVDFFEPQEASKE